MHDPDNVNALLNHLADKVLGPWMDHHIKTFPNGWIEFSDVSGSPFFIGAENCKNMSVRAIIEISEYARANVAAIKRVCETIDLPADNFVMEPWPSHIYFEDVNSQSQFELDELVLNEVKKASAFKRKAQV